MGTFEASDANTALKMLPSDADPHSGVSPALSGTGTPPPNSTPTLPSAGGAPAGAAPLPAGKESPILSFAAALQQAVELAKTHRNASSLDIMKPYQGTVAASDFNGVLDNLNRASDSTSSALIKQATDLSKTDIITATDDAGNVHGIDKNTGKVVWTAPGVGNKQGSSGGGSSGILLKSGALTYTRDEYASDASDLEQSRGQDGWVDPTVYQNGYDSWVSRGGKIADFIKAFPPVQYVNPENDWLPPYLRPKKSGSDIPLTFPGQ